jgi:hypothetical protein
VSLDDDLRHGNLDAPHQTHPLRLAFVIADSPLGPVLMDTIRPMAETTQKQRKTDDDKTDKEGTAATSTTSTSSTDAPKEDTVTQTPPPTTYAGSGVNEPIELNPVTHGEHRRDIRADI